MDRQSLVAVIVIYIAALVSLGCQSPGSSPTESIPSTASFERDREDVIEVHEALIRAYERGDVDAFVRVLEPSAELLIFHPQMTDRFDGADEVRRQLPRMFARLGRAVWSDHHALVSINGDVAWLTSQVLVESPNLSDPFLGRGTEIYVRRSDGWKLIHGHWSSVPGN